MKCSCSLSAQGVNNDLDSSDIKDSLNESVGATDDLKSDVDDEDANEDEDSWYSYVKQSLKSQAYNLSGLEFLKNPPKKPKYD